jgi:hypothetical protein
MPALVLAERPSAAEQMVVRHGGAMTVRTIHGSHMGHNSGDGEADMEFDVAGVIRGSPLDVQAAWRNGKQIEHL